MSRDLDEKCSICGQPLRNHRAKDGACPAEPNPVCDFSEHKYLDTTFKPEEGGGEG